MRDPRLGLTRQYNGNVLEKIASDLAKVKDVEVAKSVKEWEDATKTVFTNAKNLKTLVTDMHKIIDGLDPSSAKGHTFTADQLSYGARGEFCGFAHRLAAYTQLESYRQSVEVCCCCRRAADRSSWSTTRK